MEKFWQSEVGGQIRANGDHVRRELPFTARFSPAELKEIIGGSTTLNGEEFVGVQGVADLVVLRLDEIWLLDFKTDEPGANKVASKVAFHAPQLQLYARALSRIYARPETQAWLHFLATGETVPVSSATIA